MGCFFMKEPMNLGFFVSNSTFKVNKMNFKNIFFSILFVLMAISNSFTQNDSLHNTVLDRYVHELKLDKVTKEKLNTVLEKYKPLFKKQFKSSQEFNALLKLEVLEIYEILDKDQFSVYNRVKKNIEPNKKYRTKG